MISDDARLISRHLLLLKGLEVDNKYIPNELNAIAEMQRKLLMQFKISIVLNILLLSSKYKFLLLFTARVAL